MPVLLLLLVGAVEFGHLAYSDIEIVDAARAGVQYGAQNHIVASDATGMQNTAVSAGSNVSGLSATATHYCSCANGGSSSCASTDCSGSRILEYVQVNTTATVNPLFYYSGSPRTFTLTGQAIMRVEN